MATSFKDFLKEKAAEAGWKERKVRRAAWLDALRRLLGQIRDFLREVDSEGVLEISDYVVERVEEPLGQYDAPALRISAGVRSVDVVPVTAGPAAPLEIKILKDTAGNAQKWGDLSSGRVDFTNGDRKRFLLRSVEGGTDRWYATKPGVLLTEFNRECLEEILLDLLS